MRFCTPKVWAAKLCANLFANKCAQLCKLVYTTATHRERRNGSTGIDQQPSGTLKIYTPQINRTRISDSWQPLNGKWAQLPGVTGSEVPAPRTVSRQAQAGAQVGATSRVTGPLIVISKAQASCAAGAPETGEMPARLRERPQIRALRAGL